MLEQFKPKCFKARAIFVNRINRPESRTPLGTRYPYRQGRASK